MVYSDVRSGTWPDAITLAKRLIENNRIDLRRSMQAAGWLIPLDDISTLRGKVKLTFAGLCFASAPEAREDATFVLRFIRAVGRLAAQRLGQQIASGEVVAEMGDNLSDHRLLLCEATMKDLGRTVVGSMSTRAGSIAWHDQLMPLQHVEHADELLRHIFGVTVAEYQARYYRETIGTYPSLSVRDRKLLKEFHEVLPFSGGIHFISKNNFAGFSFDISELSDIERFWHDWRDAAHRFLHPVLERARRILHVLVGQYRSYLAMWTFPAHNGLQAVPPEWEDEQPTRFRWVIDELHRMAGEIVHYHQEFVSLATALGE